jgi:ribonucleotide reductase beta subunit family protein with ferritin-like domain
MQVFWAGRGLENTKLTDLYQAIIEAYVNKTDASRLFDMIVEQTPLLEKNQKDRILYFAIPALHDQFDQLQKETLLSMMDDDYTKNAVIKSLERLDKQAEK